jgi:hypothetical protein
MVASSRDNMEVQMSSANPLSFFGGMFLEIGAVIAVVAFLWQPQQGDARPALQPADYFASRPVQIYGNSALDRSDFQSTLPTYRTADNFQRLVRPEPYLPMTERTSIPQRNWNEEQRLLPSAPPAFAEMPRESRIEMAQPRVRAFAGQMQSFEQPPRYSAPLPRTAEAPRSDYYDRY